MRNTNRQLWKPHIQPQHIETLARKYGFSERLCGIMCSSPPSVAVTCGDAESGRTDGKWVGEVDVEKANVNGVGVLDGGMSAKSEMGEMEGEERDEMNHYSIVRCLSNYTSVDVGERCKSLDL